MPDAVRLSEAITEHLSLRQPRLAASTYDDEVRTLSRLLRHTGDIQCRHLKPEHVEAFMVSLLRPHTDRSGRVRPPLSPGAFNLTRHRIMPFQKYLSRRGLTRHDLLQDLDPLRVPRQVRLQAGADTLLAMIEGCQDDRDRALLALSVGTALRSHSLKSLRVGHVDLAGGTVTAWVSKTQETLVLPITADLDAELRRWLLAYAEELGRPLEPTDHLIPTRGRPLLAWRTLEDGTKERYNRVGVLNPSRPLADTRKPVQDALRRVGLPTRGQGTHTVRRSVARLLFDRLSEGQGFDSSLRVVAALLGHTDIRVTQSYIGVSADRASLDLVMRGQSFLRPSVHANVLPLRRDA